MAIRANDIAASTDEAITTGRSSFRGFSLRETAAAPAVVRIYDGASATGTLLASIGLIAGESKHIVHNEGIEARLGIFVDVVSGAIEGSIFTS